MGQILVIPGKIIFSQIGIHSDNGKILPIPLFPISMCVVHNVVIGHGILPTFFTGSFGSFGSVAQ